MRILLTGRRGQIGWELERSLSALGEIAAFDRQGLDLARPDEIVARTRAVKPHVIVNAAAYTAVDKAESEPDLALAINARAPAILAEEARQLGALLVHYSTDYVFDGTKTGPYTEDDVPNPLSVYGRAKLEGERAIQAAGGRHLILRTSWVYASRGNNFLLTILRLAREKPELRIVSDQRGTPTWARDLAAATTDLLQAGDIPTGLYHLTAAGETTWFRFAGEILRLASLAVPLQAIPTTEYPTPAMRPRNSVLSNAKLSGETGILLRPWLDSVVRCMAEVPSRAGEG